MHSQKQSQTGGREKDGEGETGSERGWPPHLLPTPHTAQSFTLKHTLNHQLIQAWNANIPLSNSSNNPTLPLTAQSELISKGHLHHIKISSCILSMVAHVTGYERVLPGSEAVRMRGSKMDFWKLSIGAFSPGPWGRKPPVVTACLRRSWRTELIEKLRNEPLLWVLWQGWLCVTCIANKGKRLNEGGFGSRAESLLK